MPMNDERMEQMLNEIMESKPREQLNYLKKLKNDESKAVKLIELLNKAIKIMEDNPIISEFIELTEEIRKIR